MKGQDEEQITKLVEEDGLERERDRERQRERERERDTERQRERRCLTGRVGWRKEDVLSAGGNTTLNVLFLNRPPTSISPLKD